jgi:Reverse transcriptase (RNA-dependent DNA polymerase).
MEVMLNKDKVLEGLIRFNYFPNQKSDACELPPLFSSEGFSLDVLFEAFKALDPEEYFSQHYTHGVKYFSSKRNKFGQLSIPEPAAYIKLLKIINDHYDELTGSLSGLNQLKLDVHDDGRVFILDYDVEGTRRDEADQRAFGKRYRIHADIKQCFSSLSCDVMDKAAKSLDVKLDATFGDVFEVWRDWKKQGLPVGPGASNVLSEFILSAVDNELLRLKPFNYYRYIDDYVCFVDDLDEAHEFIANLTVALKRLGLSINNEKTRVVELPAPLEPEWMLELYANIPHLHDDDWYGSKLQRYLDLALLLSKKHPDQFVMKYALKCVLNIADLKYDASIFRYYLNLLPFFPELTPYFSDVYKPAMASRSETTQWQKDINHCLALYIKEQRSDSMCWMIHWMAKFDIEIEEGNLEGIIHSYDTMAILTLYANGIYKKEIIQYVNEYCVSNGEDIENSWLLLYQLYLDGELVDDSSFEVDAIYKLLSDSNVSFINAKYTKELKSDLDKYVDKQIERESSRYINPPEHCGVCLTGLSNQKYFVDGKTKVGPFACMCESCFKEHGEGVGYGMGQLYKRNSKEWVLVAGVESVLA